MYSPRPLGNWKLMKPMKRGIIHSIVWLVRWVVGSVVGRVIIFCIVHMDAPTRTGRAMASAPEPGADGARDRSIPRNWLLKGTTRWTAGSHP